MRWIILSALMLGGCGANLADAQTEIVEAENGKQYAVEWDDKIEAAGLPHDPDLEMAGGDLAKYALQQCYNDYWAEADIIHCDLYVQPKDAGTLKGYLTVVQNAHGVQFSTFADLVDAREAGGKCAISGNIYQTGENSDARVRDARSDFRGGVLYSVWENGSGRTFITQVEPDDDAESEGTHGMWYLDKKDKVIRIEQERWNYCYKNPDISIDDVFKRVVRLSLKLK